MSRRLPPHLAAQLLALGQRYGIDQLDLDDDGAVVLSFDDGIEVCLVCPDPLSDLRLYCEVGRFPARPAPELLVDLLRFNRLDADTDGTVVGLTDDDPPRLLAANRVTWRRLPVADFLATVQAFVDVVDDLDALCRESPSEAVGLSPGALGLRG